jgi:hypothetical protein
MEEAARVFKEATIFFISDELNLIVNPQVFFL